MSGVKTAIDPKMTVERIVSSPIRRAILRSINSREDASVSRQIISDLKELSRDLVHFHLSLLAKYKIVYKCENYITGHGYFYSIHWSDGAQEALRLAEAS